MRFLSPLFDLFKKPEKEASKPAQPLPVNNNNPSAEQSLKNLADSVLEVQKKPRPD